MAAPGTDQQTYTISLSDPAVLDSRYDLSGSFRFRSRDFSEFDEERLGFFLGSGRRFGRRWRGQLNVRYEEIDLSGFDDDSATDILDAEGRSTITGIAFELSRSTLDSIANPGSGARIALAVEQVGLLGGDFEYTNLRAEHVVFFTLDQDFLERPTTLSFRTEVGYIPQGQDEVPVFERFYRGGRSFRGFDFRAIAPRGVRTDGTQAEETVGGTFEFFFGAQYRRPIFGDVLSGVVFIDSGTVQEDIGLDEYRVSAGVGLRIRTPLSPVPLAFDFGFPILREETDDERVFTFTIDLPF